MAYVCCIAEKPGIHDTVINLTTKEQQNTIVIFTEHVKGYGYIMFFCFRFTFRSFLFYHIFPSYLPQHRADMPGPESVVTELRVWTDGSRIGRRWPCLLLARRYGAKAGRAARGFTAAA